MSIQRIAGGSVLLLCVLYLGLSGSVRPSIMPDPSYGFAVLDSMQKGAPWNNVIEPDAQNIARDKTSFYAVWTPGQYAIPGAVMSLGASLGKALRAVMVVGSLLSLLGWLRLYRALGFGGEVATVATALIAATRSFNFSFLNYNGGELLSMAALPWIALAVLRAQDSPWFALVAGAGLLAGFYVKNSMLIYLVAWIGAVLIAMAWRRGLDRWTIQTALLTGVSAAVAVGIVYFGYIARGWTALAHNQFVDRRFSILLPAGMPLLAGTALDDVLSWAFDHPTRPLLSYAYRESTVLFAGAAAVTVWWMWRMFRTPGREVAAIQASAFALLVSAVYEYLLLSDSSGSLELSRHYRPSGYLLLPFFVAGVVAIKRPALKAIAAGVLIVPCVYGAMSFTANFRRHLAQGDAHSDRVQVTHLQLTPRTVRLLTALDAHLPPGSLVATPTPMHGLEFQRVRVLRTSAVDESVAETQATPRLGVVPNLVVIAEMSGMTDPEADAFVHSFRSYADRRWDYLAVDNQRFYVPAGQPVDRAWLEAQLTR